MGECLRGNGLMSRPRRVLGDRDGAWRVLAKRRWLGLTGGLGAVEGDAVQLLDTVSRGRGGCLRQNRDGIDGGVHRLPRRPSCSGSAAAAPSVSPAPIGSPANLQASREPVARLTARNEGNRKKGERASGSGVCGG